MRFLDFEARTDKTCLQNSCGLLEKGGVKGDSSVFVLNN